MYKRIYKEMQTGLTLSGALNGWKHWMDIMIMITMFLSIYWASTKHEALCYTVIFLGSSNNHMRWVLLPYFTKETTNTQRLKWFSQAYTPSEEKNQDVRPGLGFSSGFTVACVTDGHAKRTSEEVAICSLLCLSLRHCASQALGC